MQPQTHVETLMTSYDSWLMIMSTGPKEKGCPSGLIDIHQSSYLEFLVKPIYLMPYATLQWTQEPLKKQFFHCRSSVHFFWCFSYPYLIFPPQKDPLWLWSTDGQISIIPNFRPGPHVARILATHGWLCSDVRLKLSWWDGTKAAFQLRPSNKGGPEGFLKTTIESTGSWFWVLEGVFLWEGMKELGEISHALGVQERNGENRPASSPILFFWDPQKGNPASSVYFALSYDYEVRTKFVCILCVSVFCKYQLTYIGLLLASITVYLYCVVMYITNTSLSIPSPLRRFSGEVELRWSGSSGRLPQAVPMLQRGLAHRRLVGALAVRCGLKDI